MAVRFLGPREKLQALDDRLFRLVGAAVPPHGFPLLVGGPHLVGRRQLAVARRGFHTRQEWRFGAWRQVEGGRGCSDGWRLSWPFSRSDSRAFHRPQRSRFGRGRQRAAAQRRGTRPGGRLRDFRGLLAGRRLRDRSRRRQPHAAGNVVVIAPHNGRVFRRPFIQRLRLHTGNHRRSDPFHHAPGRTLDHDVVTRNRIDRPRPGQRGSDRLIVGPDGGRGSRRRLQRGRGEFLQDRFGGRDPFRCCRHRRRRQFRGGNLRQVGGRLGPLDFRRRFDERIRRAVGAGEARRDRLRGPPKPAEEAPFARGRALGTTGSDRGCDRNTDADVVIIRADARPDPLAVFRDQSDEPQQEAQVHRDGEEHGLPRDPPVPPAGPQHRQQMNRRRDEAEAQHDDEHRLADRDQQAKQPVELRIHVDEREEHAGRPHRPGAPGRSTRVATWRLSIPACLQTSTTVITCW